MKTNKMYVGITIIMVCFATVVSGCVSGTLEDSSVCDQQEVDFGTIPPQVCQAATAGQVVSQQISLTQTVQYNFSSAFSKVDDVSKNVNVKVIELMVDNITHDLDWCSSVQVSITGSASDGSTPMTNLASGSFASPSAEMFVNVEMNGNTLLHYLESGQVSLAFTLNGTVSSSDVCALGELSNIINFCVSASGSFSKSL